jgi:hypothetical protein
MMDSAVMRILVQLLGLLQRLEQMGEYKTICFRLEKHNH